MVTQQAQDLASFYTIGILIAIFVTYRITRSLKGRQLNSRRIFLAPVIYTLLALGTVLLSAYSSLISRLPILFIPIAIPFGLRFAGGVKLFEKNGMIYYRRSPVILIIWLVSFILRITIEAEFATTLTVVVLVNSLLCFTTGIIIGEAAVLFKKNREVAGKRDDVLSYSP
ncbi:MAG: hypothetical protein QXN66_06225 [Thermoplasmatales archaeon]